MVFCSEIFAVINKVCAAARQGVKRVAVVFGAEAEPTGCSSPEVCQDNVIKRSDFLQQLSSVGDV